MSEYMKKKKTAQTEQAKKAEALDPRQEMTNGIPNSVLQEIFAGTRKADASMLGHSETLAPSIAAKMSRAFGMDVSGVKISRSKDMAGTGMRGLAQGNRVILSPDVDLNTLEGQAILGHELSHIHAQAQGIGMGHAGLLQDASLERQADMEGMRAARGLSITQDTMDMGMGMNYGFGMQGVEGIQPLTGGISATAAAPMQAAWWKPSTWFSKKKKKPELTKEQKAEQAFQEQLKQINEMERAEKHRSAGAGNVQTEEERAAADELAGWKKKGITKYDQKAEENANKKQAASQNKKKKYVNPYVLIQNSAKTYLANMRKAAVEFDDRAYNLSKARLNAILGMENMEQFRALSEIPAERDRITAPGTLRDKVKDDIDNLKNALCSKDKASFEAQQKALNEYIGQFAKPLEAADKELGLNALKTENQLLLGREYDTIMGEIEKDKRDLNKTVKGSSEFNDWAGYLKATCKKYGIDVDSGSGTLEKEVKEFIKTAGIDPVKKNDENTGEQKTDVNKQTEETDIYGTEQFEEPTSVLIARYEEKQKNSTTQVKTDEELKAEQYQNFLKKDTEKRQQRDEKAAKEKGVTVQEYEILKAALDKLDSAKTAYNFEYDKKRAALIEYCIKNNLLSADDFDEKADIKENTKAGTEKEEGEFKKEVVDKVRTFLIENPSDKIKRDEERKRTEEENARIALENKQRAEEAERQRKSVPSLAPPSKKDVARRKGLPVNKVDVARYISGQLSAPNNLVNSNRKKFDSGKLTKDMVDEMITTVSETLRLTGTGDKLSKDVAEKYVALLEDVYAAHPDWEDKGKPYFR